MNRTITFFKFIENCIVQISILLYKSANIQFFKNTNANFLIYNPTYFPLPN